MDALLEILLHPFIDFLILAAIGGQFAKTQVFTVKRAVTKGKLRQVWKWSRKTLPFHPVVLGVFVGLVWDAAGWETPGWDSGHASLYFSAAGIFSTWGFAILKALFKPLGIEIDPSKLPGLSDPPDPPEALAGTAKAPPDTSPDTSPDTPSDIPSIPIEK